MTGVDELVAFVHTCLDDDERVARAAEGAGVERWTASDGALCVAGAGGSGYFATGPWGSGINDDTAEHIARWDPPRVLAEVEAKRRILDLHVGAHDCPEMVTGTYPADWPPDAPWGKAGQPWAHPSVEHFEDGQPCPTVRLLAQPYAGRDGWREEWRT